MGERITFISLPHPEDLNSLVLRTYFGDEGVWGAVRAALDAADATFASPLWMSRRS